MIAPVILPNARNFHNNAGAGEEAVIAGDLSAPAYPTVPLSQRHLGDPLREGDDHGHWVCEDGRPGACGGQPGTGAQVLGRRRLPPVGREDPRKCVLNLFLADDGCSETTYFSYGGPL